MQQITQITQKAARIGCRLVVVGADEDPSGGPVNRDKLVRREVSSAISVEYLVSMSGMASIMYIVALTPFPNRSCYEKCRTARLYVIVRNGTISQT